MAEYLSFDNVLGELQMDEEELKRLVSEGQIRAFRDEDRMKFRKEDIDGLKKGKMTEPTIILPQDGINFDEGGDDAGELVLVEEDTEETLLDLGGLGSEDDFGEEDHTSIPTVDFEDEGFDLESDAMTEELVFDDSDDMFDDAEATQRIDSAETFIDESTEDIGMTTEPIDLISDDDEDFDEVEQTVVQPQMGPMRGRPMPPGGMPMPQAVQAPPVSMLWVLIAGANLFLLIICGIPMTGVVTGHPIEEGKFIDEQCYDMFLKEKVFENTEYRKFKGTHIAEAPKHMIACDPKNFQSGNGALPTQDQMAYLRAHLSKIHSEDKIEEIASQIFSGLQGGGVVPGK